MEALGEKAVETWGKIEEAITIYGPEVIDAGLTVVQISAAKDLVTHSIGLVSVLVGFLLIKKVYYYLEDLYQKSIKEDKTGGEGDSDLYTLKYFVSTTSSVILLVVGYHKLQGLLDLWLWVAIFYPELAVAHKLTGL